MIIRLVCEWCGRIMKTVNSFEKVRDAQQEGEDICPTCLKKVAKMDNYFANAKQQYENRIDNLIKEIKEDFKTGLQKGDFDNEGVENTDSGELE